MLKNLARKIARPIKTTQRSALPSAIDDSPPTNRGGGVSAATNTTPILPISKRQRTLTGIGVILGIATIAWLAHCGIGHPTNTPAISIDRNPIEKSLDLREQQAVDTDLYFERRARATEEGFLAAFPFHG